MGKIIALANQKGGVGKSTTVVNLSAYLGARGNKVLCVDIDAQGNATSGFGIRKKTLSVSSYEVLIGKVNIKDAIIKTDFENISVLPATSSLSGAEVEMMNMDNRLNRLKMQLLNCKEDFDYIFIDCPPSLSLITLNGLIASNSVIIPLQCEFYSLEGLSQLSETIKLVQMKYNPSLSIEGIVFTMFDSRLNVTNQIVNEVKKYFSDKVFNTTIPRNVRLSEAPSHGLPILYYDKNSKGADSYEKLSYELLGEKYKKFKLPFKKK